MQTPSPRKLVKKARYYSHALSDEDKQALIVGEKNHNLKEWTPKDLVNHHESRSALLPHGMEKPDKTHAPADIDQDTQQSQRSLSKLADKENEPTYTETQQSSQSLHDLRSSSMPPPQLPPISLTPLLFPDHPPLELRAVHTRASSSGDYFSRTPGAPSSHPSSGRNSGTSSRVRSPLSKEFQPFQHNPQTTFDAFLAPHKLGKGEAYRDSDNAKKPKTPKNSPVGSPKTSLRRLSKMPSMPSLRKWSPQPDTSAEE
ncbi:uncharacterized protein K460DRAFT_269899 [Cucurbitaria berberidis CBS 394.84]|uniref:Uncharacterized protein n=1 Tax=Cucurbitaria berberidis CBS 394.84 TaxID=1168544 RepID=A0A9P4LDK9_9PLEO|nr:uncharacterized protein K460DRAFT_269899 [Cucurbitaria berberidis CBS 394.84]KAF1852006.1 hypothetical protein K460DRAFT_269899 [Cucurbitaria berberidis CBS 394.84]